MPESGGQTLYLSLPHLPCKSNPLAARLFLIECQVCCIDEAGAVGEVPLYIPLHVLSMAIHPGKVATLLVGEHRLAAVRRTDCGGCVWRTKVDHADAVADISGLGGSHNGGQIESIHPIKASRAAGSAATRLAASCAGKGVVGIGLRASAPAIEEGDTVMG